MRMWNATEDATAECGTAVTAVGVGRVSSPVPDASARTAGTGCPTPTGGTRVPRFAAPLILGQTSRFACCRFSR